MDTNLKALKDLYISLGGAESDVADLTASSEIIPLISSVAGGGSGGGGLLVNSVDHPQEAKAYLDKTWQEIYDAFLSGNAVVIHYAETEEGEVYDFLNSRVILLMAPSEDSLQYIVDVQERFGGNRTWSCYEPNEYPYNE